MKSNWRNIFRLTLLVSLMLILFIFPFQLPEKVGVTDFRPYWSSSYLFIHGKNFGDTKQLDHIERTLTGWEDTFTMYAWFAPSGNIILIPYTYLSFSKATLYWLITSTIAIITGSIMIWPYKKTYLWVPILVTFSYSMVLVSLAHGQVNTLEVLGLALFLKYSAAKKEFKAGISLILTTIKPHLVIITLPLLVVDMIRQRKWRMLAGFSTALLVSGLILTAIYPQWLISFWQLAMFGMKLIRETPTMNGLLVIAGKPFWGKWLWTISLGIAIFLWSKYGKGWNKRTMIDVTLLAGLTIAPVGWSYDQVMLLFPLLRIFEWVVKKNVLKQTDAWLVIAFLSVANGFSYYQRNTGISDVWFFWVPLLVASVYLFVYLRAKNPSENKANFSPL